MKIHEFDPVIYPRKLWVAVSTDTFSDRFEGVSEWDDTADAIVDCVRDKQRNLGGILVRYESKNAITIANIAHESSHIAMNRLYRCKSGFGQSGNILVSCWMDC